MKDKLIISSLLYNETRDNLITTIVGFKNYITNWEDAWHPIHPSDKLSLKYYLEKFESSL